MKTTRVPVENGAFLITSTIIYYLLIIFIDHQVIVVLL
jgi:hypothetical protein